MAVRRKNATRQPNHPNTLPRYYMLWVWFDFTSAPWIWWWTHTTFYLLVIAVEEKQESKVSLLDLPAFKQGQHNIRFLLDGFELESASWCHSTYEVRKKEMSDWLYDSCYSETTSQGTVYYRAYTFGKIASECLIFCRQFVSMHEI